jgi:hypothetical protein
MNRNRHVRTGHEDYLGAFVLLVGVVLFLAFWQAGLAGFALGFVLLHWKNKGEGSSSNGWRALVSLGVLVALALWVGPDCWQYLTLGVITWLVLRLGGHRIVTLHVSLPDSLGMSVRLNQSPVNLFVLSTAWERNGGGQGLFLGTRVGPKLSVGAGSWSNQSLTVPQDYMRRYTGASVLTEKNLIFVSYDGITRAVVGLDDIVSTSISADARRRLVVSYGRGASKAIVLEYVAKSRKKAENLAADWYHAIRPSTGQAPFLQTGTSAGAFHEL